MRRVSDAIATLIALASLAWTADLPRAVGLLLFPPQFLVAILGLSLALIFLTVRADRGAGGAVPFYDIGAAVLALAVSGWIAVRYPVLSEEVFYRPIEALSVSAPLLALVIEGLRRMTGWPLVVVAVAFIAYALLAHFMPGGLTGLRSRPDDLVVYLALDANAVLGFPLLIGSTVVIAFVLFGRFLNGSGGAAFITDLSMGLMGRFRGGSAKIAIIGSSLFGTISGSAVANVASTGVITIPFMRQGGFRPRAAAGIEAVASTGGQLMPPVMGAAAFLMAEFLHVPYRDVVIAALVPAILYYAALFIVADLDAAKAGIRGLEAARIPALAGTLAAGWHYVLPFAVLIVALFSFNLRPEVSAALAALAVIGSGLALGYRTQRLKPGAIVGILRDTGYGVRDIVMVVAAAGIVIGVMQKSGLASALPLVLLEMAGGHVVPLLLITALVAVVLGMGMPTVGVYVLLATLVAPSLVQAGIAPMSAHLYVLYFGMMSMITPPIAIAAFAAASIAGADPMRSGLMAMRFGWSAYVIPLAFVASPALILAGGWGDTVLGIIGALAAVWLGSAAIAGHLGRDLGSVERVILAAAAVALLTPIEAGEPWVYIKLAGAAAGAAMAIACLSVKASGRTAGSGP
ncbi:MAG: TRAP transporter fused permease subunit [Alphaproteobacteria bacterium]|nr:TRAP transporter fused permease subunit [Alphaproteobacteria bacterium]